MSGRILHFSHRPLVKPAVVDGSPYDALTDAIVMQQARAGTLNPAIVAALLAAVRMPAQEGGR